MLIAFRTSDAKQCELSCRGKTGGLTPFGLAWPMSKPARQNGKQRSAGTPEDAASVCFDGGLRYDRNAEAVDRSTCNRAADTATFEGRLVHVTSRTTGALDHDVGHCEAWAHHPGAGDIDMLSLYRNWPGQLQPQWTTRSISETRACLCPRRKRANRDLELWQGPSLRGADAAS